MAWDLHADILVVGSGAGGLTAALAAHDAGGSAIVVEKADRYGGTSAMSGGAVWVPGNRYMQARGLRDHADVAVAYLERVAGAEGSTERIAAYVAAASRMVDWLHEHTRLRFTILDGYPDYYAELYGGLPCGRAIGALPFDGRQLGAELARLAMSHPQMRIAGLQVVHYAHEAGRLVGSRVQSRAIAAWRLLQSLGWRGFGFRYGRDPRLFLGQALVGRLRMSLLDRNIPLWLEAPVAELVLDGDRVAGAIIRRGGTAVRVRAHRGVVLAAGGFGRNPELVAAHQRQPACVEWSAANVHGTGDAVGAAVAAGAGLEMMDAALWAPVNVVEGQPVAWMAVVSRCLPGSIIVDRSGRRFANEAGPFPEFARRMLERGAAAAPAWLIAGARYRRNYPMGAALPGLFRPAFTTPRAPGYPRKFPTLAALAAATGIDGATLEQTVSRFDEMARVGEDLDFDRGRNLVDRVYGDPKIVPNPCLAPLGRGPFFAVEVYPGNMETLGGIMVDTHGRALRPDGTPIEGLYATGNCAAPLVGRAYPASGVTIGAAMVMGYLAAHHAVAASAAPHAVMAP